MKIKLSILFTGLVIFGMLLASCGPQATSTPETVTVIETVVVEGETVIQEKVVTATPQPKGNDTLVFHLSEDPETLNHILTDSGTANSVISNYFCERLVYYDSEGNPQPWLAESWEINEDQTEITFTLHQGIKFTDGTDFNAEAVKYNFDQILDPAVASPKLTYLGSLQSVEVVDDYNVKFNFTEPYAPFFVNIAFAAGCIASPTAMEKWGEEYGRHPVGTGPYVIEEWIPGSQITFTRNENYQQFRADATNTGLPLAEKIILLVIPEEGTVQAALETGEILTGTLSADTVARFVGDGNFDVVIDKNVANIIFLEFNFNKEQFTDPKVREAISYAIDRQAAVNAALNGYADIAYSPLPAGDPGFDPDIAIQYGTPYDSEKALSLFQEAGYSQNEDGVMHDPSGQPVVWKVTSYAGFTNISRTLEVIQSNLADLGIEVTLETSEWGAFYPSLLEDNWDMDLMRWTYKDPSILNNLYRSPGHREKTPAGPYDEILDRCNSTMDPDLRNECIKEAQISLM
ncbi:MAG: ABC transporter substrate-binding protein, partial [Chloroflexi bacterium]|nr:ABC transporter substrate-binding protein [Chloroflexota bacterium]